MSGLDLADFSLSGMHLIEASAGTGKTYTLVNLYLRLILEQGREVPQILVVTFTNAATEELRARIHARLMEARRRLAQGAAPAQDDLQRLIDRAPDRELARRRLDEALIRMDEAAVYTIHGFAQRMLSEHAFESGMPFETTLVENEAELRRLAAEDYWRCRFHEAGEEEVAWAAREWKTPEKLYQALDILLQREDMRLLPEDAATQVAEALLKWRALRAALTTAWNKEGERVGQIMRTSPALNRQSYNKKAVDKALQNLARWLEEAPAPGSLPEKFELFTSSFLREKTKKNAQTPQSPVFDCCEQLAALAPRLARLYRARELQRAAGDIRRRIAEYKHTRRLQGFDDLLANLHAALGVGGEALAEAIRARFPAAMIDEFQDTDPLQYRIFSRIWGGAPDTVLLLIGDPKQAIYGFRGADIFAYLQARKEAGAHIHTLAVNWRSDSRLIAAVNRLFGRHPRPFVFEQIGFKAVAPSPEADKNPLYLDERPAAPWVCWVQCETKIIKT